MRLLLHSLIQERHMMSVQKGDFDLPADPFRSWRAMLAMFARACPNMSWKAPCRGTWYHLCRYGRCNAILSCHLLLLDTLTKDEATRDLAISTMECMANCGGMELAKTRQTR